MQQQFVPLEETPPVHPQTAPLENPSDIEEGMEQEEIADAETETETLASQQALADLLAKSKRKIRSRRIKFWGSFAFVEGINLLVLFPLVSFGNSLPAALLVPLLGLVLASMLIALIIMLRVMFMPVDFGAEELVQAGGVRAIPVLLGSLNSGIVPGHRKTLYRILAALLPQLKATDANLLTARHRRLLNNLLRFETWPGSGLNFGQQIPVEFIVSILRAYEQVGDTKAVPFVKTLAHRKARGARRRLIQKAALDCLPLLQANTGAVGQTQTLLRAADVNISTSDILLRPASETTASDPDQLLRATNSDTNYGIEDIV